MRGKFLFLLNNELSQEIKIRQQDAKGSVADVTQHCCKNRFHVRSIVAVKRTELWQNVASVKNLHVKNVSLVSASSVTSNKYIVR